MADRTVVNRNMGKDGAGTGTVECVNGVQPDQHGNVELIPEDIGAVTLDMIYPVGAIYLSIWNYITALLIGGAASWEVCPKFCVNTAGQCKIEPK